MGSSTSREGAEARAREIATIKAVAASEDGGMDTGRTGGSKSTPIQNPLHPSPKPLSVTSPGSSTDAGGAGSGDTMTPPVQVSTTEPKDVPMTPGGGESRGEPTAETEQLLARSAKLTPSDFVLLKTIGQGSFGLVLQVRCDTRVRWW